MLIVVFAQGCGMFGLGCLLFRLIRERGREGMKICVDVGSKTKKKIWKRG